MQINTCELKTVLKKATLNYSIDSVQLNITKNKIISKMISSASDAISILNIGNTILPSMPAADTLVFNFSEPSSSLVPYLNLIDDDEETNVNIHDEKITLVQGTQKSNIFFCSPQVVSVFEAESPREDIEYFTTLPIDDVFVEAFSKIKKIGSKFNKVYFGVNEGKLFMETSDRTNRFSNGLRVDICDVEYDDMVMCIDFKNIVNTMAIINGEHDEFEANFAYVPEQELGMIFIGKADESEKYYLMSRRDS